MNDTSFVIDTQEEGKKDWEKNERSLGAAYP